MRWVNWQAGADGGRESPTRAFEPGNLWDAELAAEAASATTSSSSATTTPPLPGVLPRLQIDVASLYNLNKEQIRFFPARRKRHWLPAAAPVLPQRLLSQVCRLHCKLTLQSNLEFRNT